MMTTEDQCTMPPWGIFLNPVSMARAVTSKVLCLGHYDYTKQEKSSQIESTLFFSLWKFSAHISLPYANIQSELE